MGAREKEIFASYLRGLTASQRRFRIVSAMAWVGKARRLPNGDSILRGAQRVRTAPEGFFDFVGWDEVTITPDMVGQTLAVFAGDEVKAKGDRLSAMQRALGECLAAHGGRWRVIRTPSP